MAEPDELTIDEAVSALGALEREERKKWQAVSRLKGILSLAQSLRDEEARLRTQAEKYAAQEAEATKAYETRRALVLEHSAKLEADYAAEKAEYEAKRTAMEEEYAKQAVAQKKRYLAAVAEMEGHLRRLEDERREKTASWEAEQREMAETHRRLVSERVAEAGALAERVHNLKSELSRIQAMMSGVLKGD